jgi:hypothetical protein
MATYKFNSTAIDIKFSNNYSANTPIGRDTYSMLRGFIRFNTSTITALLADITAVKLKFRVLGLSFNSSYAQAYSALSSDSNWATALAATVEKFASTFANIEGSVLITGTGNYELDINKNNLDLGGTTWMRLCSSYEYSQSNSVISIASENNTTVAYRPYLEVTSVINVVTISITKSLAYKIRVHRSIVKSLKYLIRRSRFISLSLEYKIQVINSGYPSTVLTTDKKPIVLQQKSNQINLSTRIKNIITGQTKNPTPPLSTENKKSVIINKDNKSTLQASEKNTILNAKANKKILTSRNNPSVIKSSKEDVTKLGTKNQDKIIL